MLTLKQHKFSGLYISRIEIIVQWSFRRLARSHEKQLLPSPCPSVTLSVRLSTRVIAVPSGRICVKFNKPVFCDSLYRNLVKIGQRRREFYVKN